MFRKSHRTILIGACCALWIACVVVVFNKFAYPITQFNDDTRAFVFTGKMAIRDVNNKGIPVSYSPRGVGQFISPFYVVHYGLLYSRQVSKRERHVPMLWAEDDTFQYWDIPKLTTLPGYFKDSVDWVVRHTAYSRGNLHLIYNFDWPYKGYPGGYVRAPWWSGLTDATAIVLLLRAYDVYGDSKYLDAAAGLYRSVLTPVASGGSLTELNGSPWVEEYVDPRLGRGSMSYVLNGMIYAAKAIAMYEKFMGIEHGMSIKLFDSVVKNIDRFNLGSWSYYDGVGTPANVKYHLINTASILDVYKISGDKSILTIYEDWKNTAKNPGIFWLLHAQHSASFWQFVCEIILCAFVIPILVYLLVGHYIGRRRIANV